MQFQDWKREAFSAHMMLQFTIQRLRVFVLVGDLVRQRDYMYKWVLLTKSWMGYLDYLKKLQ